jgi:hypothetical protein
VPVAYLHYHYAAQHKKLQQELQGMGLGYKTFCVKIVLSIVKRKTQAKKSSDEQTRPQNERYTQVFQAVDSSSLQVGCCVASIAHLDGVLVYSTCTSADPSSYP